VRRRASLSGSVAMFAVRTEEAAPIVHSAQPVGLQEAVTWK
jgi:hypothetical protein